VLFTDTVGFIQKLPTTLVASFRATLEEISEADLILHVVDVTHPNARQHIEAVDEVLTDLNTHDVPVLLAFNKMDGLTVESRSDVDDRLGDVLPEGTLISARTGDGLTDLLGEVEAALYADLEPVDVTIPYTEGQLIAMFHEQGFVESLDHLEHGVRLRGRVPERVALRLRAADLPGKRKPVRARANKAG
jgi:GTP-binding protein HflX